MKTEMELVPSPERNLRGAFRVDGFPSAAEPVGDLAGRAHHDPAVCGDAQDVLLSPHRRPLQELAAFLNALLYHGGEGHLEAEVAIGLRV